MNQFILLKNKDGIVIIACLLFMGALTVLGTTAYLTTSNEIKISDNYKTSEQSLYDADAGVQYGVAFIENGLKNSTFSLPTCKDTDSVCTANPPDACCQSALPTTAPSNYSFTLSPLRKSADNGYYFTSTGRDPQNKSTKLIEARIKQESAINYAAFGDVMTDLKASASVESYNSAVDTTPPPNPSSSPGLGDVGSNGTVSVKNNTDIDGNIVLGESTTGTNATLSDTGGVYLGTTDTGNIEKDPLGIIGGEYATKFTTYSASNDNNTSTPPIGANTISLGNGDVMTLIGKPGGANYYLSSITLNNGASLVVNTTNGPVNIFLTGSIDAKNGSSINTTGRPTDFSIYSNSTDSLVFKHGSAFRGLVYAPYATVEMKNSADMFGAIWASTVDIKNSGNLFFDVSMKDKYGGKDMSTTSWRNVRN
ncbi:MAG: hypothetical protein HQK79_02880 [Desulfobacterales bacterium]|nr:hypothetical protein [Desulfobacterales bacterium]